jgi:hypothetical protein
MAMTCVVDTDDATDRGAVDVLLEQVRAEYREMPGLSLTLPQAQRLWTADRLTCEEVFRRLLAIGMLKRTVRGRFVRR